MWSDAKNLLAVHSVWPALNSETVVISGNMRCWLWLYGIWRGGYFDSR